MSKADLSLPLLPNHYYHIFNRGNEKRNIFFVYKNYQYFLKRYADYTSAYLDTYSYCLLDNHFHMLIKINELEDLTTFIKLSNLPHARSSTNKQTN